MEGQPPPPGPVSHGDGWMNTIDHIHGSVINEALGNDIIDVSVFIVYPTRTQEVRQEVMSCNNKT